MVNAQQPSGRPVPLGWKSRSPPHPPLQCSTRPSSPPGAALWVLGHPTVVTFGWHVPQSVTEQQSSSNSSSRSSNSSSNSSSSSAAPLRKATDTLPCLHRHRHVRLPVPHGAGGQHGCGRGACFQSCARVGTNGAGPSQAKVGTCLPWSFAVLRDLHAFAGHGLRLPAP